MATPRSSHPMWRIPASWSPCCAAAKAPPGPASSASGDVQSHPQCEVLQSGRCCPSAWDTTGSPSLRPLSAIQLSGCLVPRLQISDQQLIPGIAGSATCAAVGHSGSAATRCTGCCRWTPSLCASRCIQRFWAVPGAACIFSKCHSALGPFHLHVLSCLHTLLAVATGADDVCSMCRKLCCIHQCCSQFHLTDSSAGSVRFRE